MKRFFLFLLLSFLTLSFKIEKPASYTYQIARMKYRGGGNWYVSPTSLPNLITFCNKNLGMNINPEEAVVEPGSPEIFNYPLIHISGNGNITFSGDEAENLRNYLIGGGVDNRYRTICVIHYIQPAAICGYRCPRWTITYRDGSGN